MGPDIAEIPLIILIAPNVSKQMGGESIKALQIYQSLVARGVRVHQITHARVRDELSRIVPDMNVSFVEEDRTDGILWRTKPIRGLSTPYFMKRAATIAQQLVDAHPGAIVHYTSPISPVLPLPRIRRARVVVGPLNGNIHHPAAFRGRESRQEILRRVLMSPSQLFHRAFFSGKQSADVLLVAGGERTYESLRIAGCLPKQFRDSLDSGVSDELKTEPIIEQSGINLRFVHNGRLVPYKGTDLAIRAIAAAQEPIELDIIGRGPAFDGLQRLVQDLNLGDRVRFLDWINHDEMLGVLRQYRAAVFPSLAEANGIVVQEAMMMGLPVIALNWGGPALLVTPETGILIEPLSEEAVIQDLAHAMDQLATDGDRAAEMARAGRRIALERGFSWADMIENWMALYRELSESTHPTPISTA